jgi:hypothetical protein
MIDTVKVLRAAKVVLTREGVWSQRLGFSNIDGSCMCAHGALNLAITGCPDTVETAHPAVIALVSAIGGDAYAHIWDWNDAPGRTVEEVLAKFDEAIAAEEAKVAA